MKTTHTKRKLIWALATVAANKAGFHKKIEVHTFEQALAVHEIDEAEWLNLGWPKVPYILYYDCIPFYLFLTEAHTDLPLTEFQKLVLDYLREVADPEIAPITLN